jgi:hypothetical protein
VTEQPKRNLMARLRARRQAEGLVRIELWLRPEHVEKVRAYVARLTGSRNGAAKK